MYEYKSFEKTALTCLDSYKLGHAGMMPLGMTQGYSNWTARSASNFNTNIPDGYKVDYSVWFGLQAVLLELNHIWNTTFFDVPWESIESEAYEFFAPYCGANGVDVSHFKTLHDLGALPLEIKALPEGSRVPIGVPLMTITNTHPDFAWLPNFLETWLSCELWKGCTSATMGDVYSKITKHWYGVTGGNEGFRAVAMHDFSMRGMSGVVDSAKSGAGHLLSSIGTDNFPAVKLINDCYAGKSTFVGCSVPATEHSVQSAGIGVVGELETYRELLTRYPAGIVSIVSDTIDYWSVIAGEDSIAYKLKDMILNRVPDSMGFAKVVFRPDSGDPVQIICGDEIVNFDCSQDNLKSYVRDYGRNFVYSNTPHGEPGEEFFEFTFRHNQDKYYKAGVQIEWGRYDKQYYFVDDASVSYITEVSLTPEQKGSLDCLAEIFGTTTNELGFKTLNQRVGLIYGDSITPTRANEIYRRMAAKGYAADNIVLGIGSYTYQFATRDSLGFAMKMTYAFINGVGVPIYKDPVTDTNKVKKSLKGLIRVDLVDGKYKAKDCVTVERSEQGELQRVYLNGTLIQPQPYSVVRTRLGNIVL